MNVTNAADHFPYRALRIPHPLCFLPFFAQDHIHNVSESLTGKQHALCTLSNYGTIVHRYLWYRTLQLSLCRCKLLRIRRHNSINTGAGAPGVHAGICPDQQRVLLFVQHLLARQTKHASKTQEATKQQETRAL